MIQHRLLDSEHSKELFAYFGLAVYYSQALEQQLVNLLVLTKLADGKDLSEAEIEDLYHRKLGSSLGQLVHEIRHNFEFTDEEVIQLNEIWKQRNYIVHDYFKKRIQETFSPAGRSRMIRELSNFKDRAQELEQKLQRYARDMYIALGQEEDTVSAGPGSQKQRSADS
ncbi:hypothetical protein Q5741_04830 [Paenibacillus sp. JX-17]|uniref:Uncharacterized protein n=1 Tax=Paenibacillus lacisoli TaxID=3064525 RepID=A0ABT9C914_9BACL|nr:hypothetical protein [Paenibacillus sp. JX-17]MDO7905737.1 hypothetical protein [Paenibacillus sp. JX-17]